MPARPSLCRSTIADGLFSRCFSTGMKVCPPASALASHVLAQHADGVGDGGGLVEGELVHRSVPLYSAAMRHRVHEPLRRIDRLDDVVVAGAAAEIALQPVPDLVLRHALRVHVHQVDRAHHHARRAEAALQRVVLAEHLLHGMQRAVRGGQALDGGDRAALRLHGQHGAALHAVAVDMDDARAALAGVAADMGAGQAQLLAQQLHQQRAAFDLDRVWRAVHRQADLGHGVSPNPLDFVLLPQECGSNRVRSRPGCLVRRGVLATKVSGQIAPGGKDPISTAAILPARRFTGLRRCPRHDH